LIHAEAEDYRTEYQEDLMGKLRNQTPALDSPVLLRQLDLDKEQLGARKSRRRLDARRLDAMESGAA
jgi:hypothetical protein